MALTYELVQISPKDIEPNKENPRGESVAEISRDKSFEQLKDSVAQFGVLVPVVVHRQVKGKNKYLLIDGERRWRAALATGLETIPAHIAIAVDRMEELVQAFHIHMLRKQWKPISQARALKRIKAELKRKKMSIDDRELLDQLQEQTGCTDSQLKSLERGIRYSDATLKEVDDGRLLWSHLVQFEASFVEQLEQHYSGLLRRLGNEHVREVLVKKAEKKILTSTRALMENIAPIILRAKSDAEKKTLEKLLYEFIRNELMSAEEVKKKFEREFPPSEDQVELATTIVSTSEDMIGLMEQVDAEEMVSFQKQAKVLRNVLTKLKEVISRKLSRLNKLLS